MSSARSPSVTTSLSDKRLEPEAEPGTFGNSTGPSSSIRSRLSVPDQSSPPAVDASLPQPEGAQVPSVPSANESSAGGQPTMTTPAGTSWDKMQKLGMNASAKWKEYGKYAKNKINSSRQRNAELGEATNLMEYLIACMGILTKTKDCEWSG
ncbi:hypothetical protein CspHIS471_0312730 [Cutaneotrichosporon sp. HIS471]|nr:hypothetical protein CspHIS471_0312730 [Cutaneotrichosporon sp. HIS471]